ncbi:MAG TPA: serine/threonine-protein kinase [Phycisphaerales bacterium]|nr:serine/threonine-protein kinase [Phycisphaerales bacterium]HRQ75047.1 serine/threonine-protein kinase [Phycisphaerales bacterium]
MESSAERSGEGGATESAAAESAVARLMQLRARRGQHVPNLPPARFIDGTRMPADLSIAHRDSAACPTLCEIESALAGAAEAPNLVEHLHSCETCAIKADEIARNQRFLSSLAEEDRIALARSLADGSFADSLPMNDIEGYGFLGTVYSGGQAIVYEAVQRSTNRKVALKVLLRGEFATLSQRERFQCGIALAATLRHPNVVAVHDSGETADGRLYCVMEYIHGQPLDRFLASRRLAPGSRTRAQMEAMMRMFAKLCDAVHHAHRAGVIHRDVKPQNVLVDEAFEPHLCDFGLAVRARTSEQPTGSTVVAGAPVTRFAGTPAFTPPEQLRSSADEQSPVEPDEHTDVYALGMTLYQMLAGRLAYSGASSVPELLRDVDEGRCHPPTAFASDVDRDLGSIAMKAIHHDRAKRYASAAAMREDIMRWINREPVTAHEGHWLYRVKKWSRRHWPELVALIAAVVALLLFVMRTVGM